MDNCFITDESEDISCVVNSTFNFEGELNTLNATITCPLAAVTRFTFANATREAGLCECDARLIRPQDLLNGDEFDDDIITNATTLPGTPLDCSCYICPPGSALTHAYECTDIILGGCRSFGCNGSCNPQSVLDVRYDEQRQVETSPSMPFADCVTSDTSDVVVCPANINFEFNGAFVAVLGDVTCPLDAIEESSGSFIQASQDDLCTCENEQILVQFSEPKDVQCNCYACPLGSFRPYSFSCNRPIVGDCFGYDCGGFCNGDRSVGTGNATFAPTEAPTGLVVPTSAPTTTGGSPSLPMDPVPTDMSAAFHQDSTSVVSVVLSMAVLLFRMF